MPAPRGAVGLADMTTAPLPVVGPAVQALSLRPLGAIADEPATVSWVRSGSVPSAGADQQLTDPAPVASPRAAHSAADSIRDRGPRRGSRSGSTRHTGTAHDATAAGSARARSAREVSMMAAPTPTSPAPPWLGAAVRQEFANSTGLAVRERLYCFEEPPIDVHGLVAAAVADCRGPIIDVGCGSGSTLVRLDRHASADAVGLDVSMAMLRTARARSGLPRLVQGDLASLPLSDARVGAVIAAHVLYLASEPIGALAELARVLRPDGILVIATTGADDKLLIQRLLLDALCEVLPVAEISARDVHRRFDIDAAVAGLRALGFGVRVRDAHAEIRLTHPGPLLNYISSLQPLFAPGVGTDEWMSVLPRIESALWSRIRANGKLVIPTHVGVVRGCR